MKAHLNLCGKNRDREVLASKFVHQASTFRTIISNADDSEILAHAD